MSSVHDVVILGSGPAGFTAAIYAARANLKPLLLVRLAARRPAHHHHRGRELPRLPRGHPGARADGRDARAGGALRHRDRRGHGRERGLLAAPVPSCAATGREYQAKSVIIATGASRAAARASRARQTFMGFGVSACATCDGFFFKRQARDGGGRRRHRDGGGQLPDALLRRGDVVHRRDELRALEDHAGARAPEPEDLASPERRGRRGAGRRTSRARSPACACATREDRRGQPSSPIDGIFVAIGHQPNTAFLQGALPLDEKGYVVVEPGTPRTASPACSPPATWPTRSTARRSRPPAAAAWRRSTPSAGSKHGRTAPDAPRRRRHGARGPRVRRPVRRRGPGRARGRDPPRRPDRAARRERSPRAPRASSWARSRSPCSRRAPRSARTASRARCSTRARCDELMPDWRAQGCPLASEVAGDDVYFLRESGQFRLPFLPPMLQNHGNYVVSLGNLVEWLAGIAEAKGVLLVTETPAVEPLLEDGRAGRRAHRRQGRGQARQAEGQLRARRRLPREGDGALRGPARHAGQGARDARSGSRSGRNPQVYATGVKEVWELPPRARAAGPRRSTPWAGRSPTDTFGGGFLYGMDDSHWSLGLVTGLDSPDPANDPHAQLPALEDAPAAAPAARGRQAGRLRRQGDARGRLVGDAEALGRRRCSSSATRAGS